MASAFRLTVAAQVIKEFGVSIDQLPYTPEFGPVADRFRSLIGSADVPHHEVWDNLAGARKRGLVGQFEGHRTSIRLVRHGGRENNDRRLQIAAQLLTEPGCPPSDRLPYTIEFEIFRARFIDLLGQEVSCHEVWQAVLSARKSGRVGATRRRQRVVGR